MLLLAACSDPQVVLGVNALNSDTGPLLDGSLALALDSGLAEAEGSSAVSPDGAGVTTCGATGESCSVSLVVKGGTYYRTYGNSGGGPTGEADSASVSDFRLDKYLVTVGRFRSFVAAYHGGTGWTPPVGAGKHAHLNGGKGLNATGGGYEPGWVASDNVYITLTDADLACTGPLVANLAAGSHYATWTPVPDTQETLPISCVDWYEAYAFCIWDGGFLPSETELGYAAAGGSAQREYPWGNADPAAANLYAIYGCYFPNGSGSCLGVQNIAPVGSAPLGVGLWGQLDLAGNLWEWAIDGYASYVNPCVDCANFSAITDRATRGGNFNALTNQFPPARHGNSAADANAYAYGFRCARTP